MQSEAKKKLGELDYIIHPDGSKHMKYVIGTDGKPDRDKPIFVSPFKKSTRSTYVPDHPACVPGKYVRRFPDERDG